MGKYVATTTAFADFLIGITFDTATTVLVGKCIGWAESEVNKYLSKRYDISSSPFDTYTTAPPLAVSWTEWLGESFFHSRNSRGSKESLARAREIRKDAIENLKLVADYKLDLLDSTGSVIPDMSNTAYRVMSNTDDYATTINEDDPLNWKISSQKLDDIDSERE